MAKYLRPRRGTKTNATSNNIVLKKGEMFLCMSNNDNIGKGPGAMYIGDGASSFSQYAHDGSTVANTAQPFLVHPRLYKPIFANSNPQTSNFTVDAATAEINNMGSGISLINLPTIIGYIKAALCKHANSVNRLALDVEDAKGVQLTQAQYDALSTAQKNNGTEYYITDGADTGDTVLWGKVGTDSLLTNAQDLSGAINEYYTSKVNSDYYTNHFSSYIVRSGTWVRTITATTQPAIFTNAQCNSMLGVSNSTNGNTVVVLTNGDHAAQGADVIGTFYYNGSWYARMNATPAAGAYRFNYFIVYFG